MRARLALFGTGLIGGVCLLSGCLVQEGIIKEEWVDNSEPTQTDDSHPMTKRGSVAFDQRKSDCWDMPNAQACYDVGLNYELGLAIAPNKKTALQYYDKACQIDKQAEHCEAAKRLRAKVTQESAPKEVTQ